MRVNLTAFVCITACAGEPATGDFLENWFLEPEFTLGAVHDGPVLFSDIRDIEVDRAGRMYVLDVQTQEIAVFDSTGILLRLLGRPGPGPGEFRQAIGIAVDSHDQLWVYDPVANRLTVFDSAGAVTRTIRFPVFSFGFGWMGGVDELGGIYDDQWVERGGTHVRYLRRTHVETGRIDTLPWPECGVERPPAFIFPHGRMQIPFATGELLDVDPRGVVWCADTREIRVAEYAIGETTPRRFLVAEGDPAPVTRADRDSVQARIEWFKGLAGETSPDLSLIPSTKPVVESIGMDDEGLVWVRARIREGLFAIVFDTTGVAVARVALPLGAVPWLPPLVRNGRLYTVNLDSLGVPVVAAYRVVQQQ